MEKRLREIRKLEAKLYRNWETEEMGVRIGKPRSEEGRRNKETRKRKRKIMEGR